MRLASLLAASGAKGARPEPGPLASPGTHANWKDAASSASAMVATAAAAVFVSAASLTLSRRTVRSPCRPDSYVPMFQPVHSSQTSAMEPGRTIVASIGPNGSIQLRSARTP
jgi:anti-sigma-K factor RskA